MSEILKPQSDKPVSPHPQDEEINATLSRLIQVGVPYSEIQKALWKEKNASKEELLSRLKALLSSNEP